MMHSHDYIVALYRKPFIVATVNSPTFHLHALAGIEELLLA